MGWQPIKSASAPAHKCTALPSGSPAEHHTVGALLEKRRKFEEEKFAKVLEKNKRKDKRLETKSQKRVKEATQGARQK